MLKRILLLFVAAAVLQACGSGTSDINNQIDYATLDTLQTEVALEIGETEDYLPGQLVSLAVTPGGDILVADRASTTIEQFDASGNHRATIAREGSGPGEVSNFFSLHQLWNDTLLVSQALSQRDFFVPDEKGIYRFHHSLKSSNASERSFSIFANHSDTSYFATEIRVFGSSLDEEEDADYRQNPLVLVNSAGELLQDSVQIYKQGNWLVERTSNSITVRGIPFRLEDDVSMVGNGNYLIARVDSSAIYHYNSKHELVKKYRSILSSGPSLLMTWLTSWTRTLIRARAISWKPALVITNRRT